METITKAQIENAIYQHEQLSGVWLWHAGTNANGRRYNEHKWSLRHPAFAGTYRGHEIQVYPRYKEYYKNVYYTMRVIIDGKKTNVRGLKKLIGLIPTAKKVG